MWKKKKALKLMQMHWSRFWINSSIWMFTFKLRQASYQDAYGIFQNYRYNGTNLAHNAAKISAASRVRKEAVPASGGGHSPTSSNTANLLSALEV